MNGVDTGNGDSFRLTPKEIESAADELADIFMENPAGLAVIGIKGWMDKKDWQSVIGCCQEMLDLPQVKVDDKYYFHKSLAYAFIKTANYEQAITESREARKIKVTASAFSNEVYALYKLGRHQEALTLCDQAEPLIDNEEQRQAFQEMRQKILAKMNQA